MLRKHCSQRLANPEDTLASRPRLVPDYNGAPNGAFLHVEEFRSPFPLSFPFPAAINVCYLCIMNADKLSNKDTISEALLVPSLPVLPTTPGCEDGRTSSEKEEEGEEIFCLSPRTLFPMENEATTTRYHGGGARSSSGREENGR